MTEWIKCSDRLPEQGEPVMVYSRWGMHLGKNWYGHTWNDDHGYEIDDVTHWTEMPNPPKKDEQ